MTAVPMIDVSSLQHPNGVHIDWCAVARSNVRAVMIKATEGVDYVNPYLSRDAHGARAAGLLVGYYHFCHPSHSDAQRQVAYFTDAIKTCPPHELGLAMDLETTEGFTWPSLESWGREFQGYLDEHTSWPIDYTNLNFHNQMPLLYAGRRMWLAEPSARPRMQCWAWQQEPRNIDGISVQVDYSTLFEVPHPALR